MGSRPAATLESRTDRRKAALFVRLQTRVWRAHNPRWAWAPDSGQGAALHGGRFNPKGVSALYTSLGIVTAMAEAQQGFVRKAQPMTMVAYEVDCDDVLDLTDPATLAREAVAEGELRCAWQRLAVAGEPVPSWRLAQRLIAQGIAAIIVPSFAPGAAPAERNVVFWRWSRAAPHRVVPIDDYGRLPHAP
jgi:RES domain-containing protein